MYLQVESSGGRIYLLDGAKRQKRFFFPSDDNCFTCCSGSCVYIMHAWIQCNPTQSQEQPQELPRSNMQYISTIFFYPLHYVPLFIIIIHSLMQPPATSLQKTLHPNSPTGPSSPLYHARNTTITLLFLCRFYYLFSY